MDRATTQSAAIAKAAASRTYTYKCGRCHAAIKYDAHTDWPTVSLLVNEHYFNCPMKLNFYGESVPSHTPSETNDTRNAPSPLQDSDENLDVTDSNHDNQFIAGCSKQRKSEAQRKQELEDDEYTYNVCPTSVRCRGCEKEISLDKRSRYYPGLWTKHRRKCTRIQKTEKEKLAGSEEGFCPSNAERRPTAASSFELDNPRADGISRTANSVKYHAPRSMELSDDKDPEEGDQDHIPFSSKSVLDVSKQYCSRTTPALNQQFYNECWQRGERLWKYRYATTKEIMEQTLSDLGS
ncbi:hypothetical protein EDB19DRAFT_895717 [Suillus lakei]|nr:hypothetical protein EDB19DRAFT_895717 [Suillus lakei]